MYYKIIKDVVHGYIRVPYVYFTHVIDTEVFQRLRRIEQTSMRILYPSARHDRFIHSLGTYYLGDKAFDCLMDNIMKDKLYKDEDKLFWKNMKVLFTLACLLHDCAHAPFSHSFEYLYLESGEDDIRNRLNSLFQNDDYKKDISENRAAEHEMASAIMVKKYFSKGIESILKLYKKEPGYAFSDGSFDEYIEFIARCIVGCKYNSAERHKQYKNCLISLLNSSSFDVDKLDYIIRDSALSGIDNVSIDVDRLLGSLTIVQINEIDGNIKGDVNGIIMGNFDGTMGSDDNKCDVSIKMTGPDKINLDISGKVSYDTKGSNIESEGKFYHDENRNFSISAGSRISGTAYNVEITGLIYGNIRNKSLMDGYVNGYMGCKFKGEILGRLSWENEKIRYEIGFNKSSLSVIQDTISARNRLYVWVYTHHKVIYADYLLRKSVLLGIDNYYKTNIKDKGAKTDLRLMEHLLNVYGIDKKHKIVSYNTNIYSLYNEMFRETDPENIDILQLLKEHEHDPVKKGIFDLYYSDILLIFDFDPHDPQFSADKISKMNTDLPDTNEILQAQLLKMKVENSLAVLCTCVFYIADYNTKFILL